MLSSFNRAACDAERAQREAQVAQFETEAAAANAAAQVYVCPSRGAPVTPGAFCMNYGAKLGGAAGFSSRSQRDRSAV